jgi:hypothetical protein
MLSSKKPGLRGGAYRTQAPDVDEGLVLKAMGKFICFVGDLGDYENKSRSDQPDGSGLVHLKPLLDELLLISETAQIAPGVLRKCFLKLVFERPDLNATVYNNGVWAGLRQERFVCILNHLRRLAREKERFRQVAAKLTAKELKDQPASQN